MRRFLVSVLLACLCVARPCLADEVPLTRDGGVYHVPVTVNHSLSLNFVVDSGAADVVLPQTAAERLLQAGALTPSDRLADGIAVTADGTRIRTPRYTLKSVTVGGVTVEDVRASVVPTGDEALLGEAFLEKLPYWALDTQRMVLVLGSSRSHVGDTARLFSQGMVEQLNRHIDSFHQRYGKDVVVITVPSLSGHTRDEVVDQFTHGRLNGVLILVAVKEKETFLKVGNETAKVLTPERQAALKKAINDQFRQGKFDDGIKAGMMYIEKTWADHGAHRQ